MQTDSPRTAPTTSNTPSHPPQPLVRLAQPALDPDEIAAVARVLESGNLVQGSQVAAFEAAVAHSLEVKHAVACSSGTSALHLALLALDLQPGDEVIVPDYTFPATSNMVEAVGARPVVVDIDPDTFNMRIDALEAAISPRTKAIMPVHLFGLCADMGPILELAFEHDLTVVEDAACALGARWTPLGGRSSFPVGQGSRMACLSFHPRKIITTGEGGMVVTNDDATAENLRQLRNHGTFYRNGRMVFQQVGYNFRLTEMQGAMGVTQMARLSRFLERRQRVAAIYHEGLSALNQRLPRGMEVVAPAVPDGFVHAYQSFVVRLPKALSRDRVIDELRALGVESTIGTYALHAQPFYQEKLGLNPADFPGAEWVWQQSLALPVHHRVSDDDARRVLSALEQVVMK